MEHIPLSDWVSLIIAVLGIIGTIIGRYWPALPREAAKVMAKLGGQAAVEKFILEACEAAKTDETRRAWVLKKLKALAPDVPDSILNLILEFAYTRFKKRLMAT